MRRQAAITLLRSLTSAATGQAGAKASNVGGAAGVLLRRGFADDASLMKTPLYDFHVAHGGEGNLGARDPAAGPARGG